jgi:uncharacterized iron-regulated protein
MLRYILFACLLSISALVQAQAPAANYTIFNTKTGAEVSFADMLQSLSNADAVLFGEEHNDSIGHMLELDVLQHMHQQHGDKLALSLEMFETDVQGIMDEYLAGWISEKNFKKESRSWNNYNDYRPLIQYAQEKHLQVVCANAPARYTNMVTRNGLTALLQLPKATQKAYLPPMPVDTLTGAYYDQFLEVMGGHTVPNMQLYQSQNLWDATMSYSITRAMKNKVVLHLNGRFHSDRYLGTAYRVIQQHKKKNVYTISCFRADRYTPAEHQPLADFVILTRL